MFGVGGCRGSRDGMLMLPQHYLSVPLPEQQQQGGNSTMKRASSFSVADQKTSNGTDGAPMVERKGSVSSCDNIEAHEHKNFKKKFSL
jgi:hypothetical protein